MLYSDFEWAGQPPKLPLLRGILTPVNTWFLGPLVSRVTAKRYVDRFSRFYGAQTDTQTTLRVTSVAIGRIYAMHAMRPNNANN